MGIVMGKISAEMPAYTVVSSTPEYEIRQFGPQVLATHDGLKPAQFRGLASYYGIFFSPDQLDDERRKPIAMTAPVLQETLDTPSSAGETSNMSFVLPAHYTIDTAPAPSDKHVHLREIPGRMLAVLTFSGNIEMPKTLDEKSIVLRALLEKDGIKPISGDEKTVLAGYNPPWTLASKKRNEILLSVDPSTVKSNVVEPTPVAA